MLTFTQVVFVVSVLSFTSFISSATNKVSLIDNENADNAWWVSGKKTLQQRLNITQRNNQAKNVILFIGDGMGISTITAARIFDGQSRGESGEENSLSFEKFPHVALVKTYSVDAQVADSASTASAMNTGVKTKFTAVSVWGNQPKDDCYGPEKNFPKTIAEIAETIGLSTGIVTTDKVTYATPAAVYAHSPSRNWESDADIPLEYKERGCQDIAQQLVNFPYGDGLDVIMGGGLDSLLPISEGGKRLDNQNLVNTWQSNNPNGKFVSSASELRDKSNVNADKLFGVFASHHMAYAADKNEDKEPTLAEMTSSAIGILSKNPKGYFLMVENGHIDHAHHKNNAYRALSDTQAFAYAIEAALNKVDLNNTLVLVTADHSHPLTMIGYPKRGNPILGNVKPVGTKGGFMVVEGLAVDDNNIPYTTLGYRVGPQDKKAVKANLLKETTHKNYHQKTAIPMHAGFHGGEDVALFATGPQSHLVGGVLEQNVIFHIITQALGWNDK